MVNNSFRPRPSQADILTYGGGTLGISAVPGSGKTHILSALAAKIIASGELGSDQEVLVVTLVNSAVDNFSARIGGFIRLQGLIPHIGYRVRTLHGLANDLVRENPSLVGLDNRFVIIDESEAELIRKNAANAWLSAHPDFVDLLLSPDIETSRKDWIKRNKLPQVINSLATAFIRSAKNLQQSPESLRTHLNSAPSLPLAELGWDIFANYQRALAYRGAVDFDDLIRLALEAITVSPELLRRMQLRFPYILEDEAQDSSSLQEEILSKLSTGNWVRVGDPNQAIFETFTTARPEFLLNFIKLADFQNDLPVSGRSQPSIIGIANHLIQWVCNEHPIAECRSALRTPYIQITEKDDPQSNPPDKPEAIYLIGKKYSPDGEVQAVIKSLLKWLPDNQDKSVAVLVPTNHRGIELITRLKENKIEFFENLASTQSTRAAAGALGNIVVYLSDPSSASKLAKVYQVWRRAWRSDVSLKVVYDHVSELIRKCLRVEDYLAPRNEIDWLAIVGKTELENIISELEAFRIIIRRWQGTTLLPIDQMILTLAQDLFIEPADLAVSHKLALVLRQVANNHFEWRLPELTAELLNVARNERKFLGFSSEETGFDPDKHRGKVVVSTIHKAKGLEWDRVYLMSVNNYDFPSGMSYDGYISEKWFIKDSINIEAESLAQLENAISKNEFEWKAEGEATQQARIDYVKERLRLLYVGITRAKLELVITWNTGKMGTQRQALPFAALQAGLDPVGTVRIIEE